MPAYHRQRRGSLRAARLARPARLCASPRWRGDAGDPSAVERAIETARLDALVAACSESAVADLQFRDVSEIQRDVVRFCREFEDAAVSLIFDPVSAPAPPLALACAEAASRGDGCSAACLREAASPG